MKIQACWMQDAQFWSDYMTDLIQTGMQFPFPFVCTCPMHKPVGVFTRPWPPTSSTSLLWSREIGSQKHWLHFSWQLLHPWGLVSLILVSCIHENHPDRCVQTSRPRCLQFHTHTARTERACLWRNHSVPRSTASGKQAAGRFGRTQTGPVWSQERETSDLVQYSTLAVKRVLEVCVCVC